MSLLRPETELREAQRDIADFILEGVKEGDGSLILAKPGSGKTAATLTAIAELFHADQHQAPIWIIAPKFVAETVWHSEAERWVHLHHLRIVRVMGKENQRHKLLAQTPRPHIYVINYELVPWLFESNAYLIAMAAGGVVFDEISRLKGRGTWFKLMKKWSRKLAFRVGLTGTLKGNQFTTIWAPAHMIDTRNRLERSYTAFRTKYLYPADFKQYKWKLLPGSIDLIAQRLSEFSYQLRPEDYPDIPDTLFNDILLPELPDEVSAAIKTVSRKGIVTVKGKKIIAKSKAQEINLIRQLTSGFVYTDSEEKEAVYIDNTKYDVLANLIEELDGAPLLVFYEFIAQKDMLRSLYGSEIRELDADTIDDWNAGRIPLLMAHVQSAGHGLNLQHGGCDMCFLTLPFSSELFQQAVKRLARPGQERKVTVHRIMFANSIDTEIATRLEALADEAEMLDSLTVHYSFN